MAPATVSLEVSCAPSPRGGHHKTRARLSVHLIRHQNIPLPLVLRRRALRPGAACQHRPAIWPRTRCEQRGSLPARIGDAIDCVAALSADPIWADLTDALEDINLEALLGEAGKEPADGMGTQPIASAICGTLAPSSRRSMAGTFACFVSFRGR
jgi:hypothetical protein